MSESHGTLLILRPTASWPRSRIPEVVSRGDAAHGQEADLKREGPGKKLSGTGVLECLERWESLLSINNHYQNVGNYLRADEGPGSGSGGVLVSNSSYQ